MLQACSEQVLEVCIFLGEDSLSFSLSLRFIFVICRVHATASGLAS